MSGNDRWALGLHNLVVCIWAIAVGGCSTDPVASLPATPDQTADPHFNCLIPTSRIFDGGVGRDGIPALDFPQTAVHGAASFMHDSMRVIGVEINGAARAYPLFILWWHEIVNDTLGGRRVLMSYCPLTGSGLAFDPIVDGSPRRFGVSGLLFENNLIMFDRETESFWNQLLMGAQCGPQRGFPLFTLPVSETTWGHWKKLHPTTTVLTDDTGHVRPYGTYPYGDYAESDNDVTLLPSSEWNRSRPPKELTLGVRVGLFSMAYPFGLLDQVGSLATVNDRVGPHPVLVTWNREHRTARAFGRRLSNRELTFDVAGSAPFIFRDRETGSTWSAGGEAVSGPLEGERLTPVTDAWTLFWFSWSVYNPGTSIFAP